MSFSITPSDTIRKHPTNHSTSKEVHQFSKTPRFLAANPEYLSTDSDAPTHSIHMIASSPTEKLPSATATS